MNAKNGRRNTDFQLAYFLAGSCHTPDGAYALLCELRDEREQALAAGREVMLRAEADAQTRAAFRPSLPGDALRVEADAMQATREEAQRGWLMGTARRELATINKLIERVQPHRRFAHLPDHEAHEAAQVEEWRLELIARAENAMLGEGRVPADTIAAMRQHPAWSNGLSVDLAAILEGGQAGERAEALLPFSPVPALLLG